MLVKRKYLQVIVDYTDHISPVFCADFAKVKNNL